MRKIILILSIVLFATQVYAARVDMAKVSEMYNNAVLLNSSKKYDLAILEFKKVLRMVPYEDKVRHAIITSYVARAQEYNKQKEIRKALNDLKSAMCYLDYWGEKTTDPAKLSIITSTTKSIADLQKELGDSTAPDKLFAQAKSLRTQGELAASIYDFNQLFNNSTYSKQALENAGDIYKSLNNDYKAMDSYRQLLKKDPGDAVVHFKYATILDAIGNSDAAADEYNNALKYGENNPEVLSMLENLWKQRTIENPKDAQAFINLGAIYQKKGNHQAAMEQYNKAQMLDPTDKTMALNMASLYVSKGDYAGAIKAYNLILDKDPNNAEVIGYKASAYMQMKDYKNAMAQYKMVLAVDPNNAAAGEKLNEILTSKLSGKELMNYLEVQANSNPTDYNAQYEYAYNLHKNKEYKKAIPYYTLALNIDPKREEGYLNLIQLYTVQGDYKSSQAVITQGLLYLPDSKALLAEQDTIKKTEAGGLYQKASDYFTKGDYKNALMTYMQIQYQTPEVISSIAASYYELQDYSAAIDYFGKVLSQNPKDTEAMYFMASSYLNMGNEDRAKEYLQKILALEPGNKNAKDALAGIDQGAQSKMLDSAISLYEAKDYSKALDTFNKIIASEPNNAYAHYYKGAIFDEQKQQNEAVQEYRKVISIDPNFSLAYYALATNLDGQEKYADAVSNYDKYIALRASEKEDDYIKYAKSRSKELKDYLKSK